MDRQKTDNQPMPTIWEIPDEVWPVMQTILDQRYPASTTVVTKWLCGHGTHACLSSLIMVILGDPLVPPTPL
jgi:hypothetical protein